MAPSLLKNCRVSKQLWVAGHHSEDGALHQDIRGSKTSLLKNDSVAANISVVILPQCFLIQGLMNSHNGVTKMAV